MPAPSRHSTAIRHKRAIEVGRAANPVGWRSALGFRSSRCGRAKLPVFFRSSFLAGALRIAITSALMHRKSMPHRLGAGARAEVIDGSGQCCWSQMDAATVDVAPGIAKRSARRR